MKLYNFNKKELINFYEKMVTSRFLYDKMLIMLKQGKSWFHIGASGHEAAQLAAASLMRPNQDWSFPYYRDGAYCLGLGMTPKEQLLLPVVLASKALLPTEVFVAPVVFAVKEL